MNILDVIKDCIANPYFVRDYNLEELTVKSPSKVDTMSVGQESSFTGFSNYKSSTLSGLPDLPKMPMMDQRLMRLYMRVWSGLGRLVLAEISRGNCFVSLDIGYFYPYKDESVAREGQGKMTAPNVTRVCYSPTLELLDKYQFSLFEDPFNVLPSNREVSLALPRVVR